MFVRPFSRRIGWSLVLLASLIGGRARADAVTLTPAELADGWILLFDGETTFGWEAGSDADWKVVDGALSAASGQGGLLATTSEFADYVLKVDFRAPAETNSGIFLRTPVHPTDPAKDCYELNIASPALSPFPTGSFVNRQKGTTSPATSDWQSYEVRAEGGHFVVTLDGQTVLDYTDPQPLGRGRIGLQFRTGPVQFRNIKLRPLGLASLFNGRDLKGWKTLPDQKSVFSVTDKGELNVKNGKGQLETEARFADFTLQLEVFSNGRHLNSGIFFRSIPGEMQNGYECQIQNGFAEGDRTKPLDCGTGGFYRRQNARKVVANDFEWFHMTLIASGKHMAAWVNGYPVSDWTDPREPDPNPRKGLRTAAGTLIIQGHDPTTDLSFRNLRAGEMAPR
jgi:3-keto-disaccharide hydrolase